MNGKFNNRDPVYVQVIRQFKEDIVSGRLIPGQEVPSRRELANQLKINPNTAQRAYKEMEEQQLIYTEGNMPSKITEDQNVLKAVREELIGKAVETFVSAIRPIDLPLEEVVGLIEAQYKEISMVQEGKR